LSKFKNYYKIQSIFDKKHYQDNKSFDLLSKQIDKLIDECDLCFFMPNDFNIRDEFKPVNGFKQQINLATETNDIVRTFWEQYTLNKAAEKQKGISGICGGHQMIANAMGFFVCRLSAKHLHKELKEKDKASSPTRGGEFVDVYSQHTQGVPLSVDAVCEEDIKYYNNNYEGGIDAIIKHNNSLLKELNLDAATNNQHSGIVMKDLRLKDDNIRQIISTQGHPENLQIADDRSQNIMRQFIEKPVVLSSKISKIIADNTQSIINNTGLANNYITIMKNPEDLFNNLLSKQQQTNFDATEQNSSQTQLKRRKGDFKKKKVILYHF
jgi:anthranilate/para-aminobenzoate synthase component II